MRKIVIVTLLLLALTTSAQGQIIPNQFKLNHIADTFINPAHLHSKKWFEFSLGLPLDIDFNSWSIALLNQYGNKDWDEKDKEVILKATNKDHLRLKLETQPYAGLKLGPLGLRANGQAQAHGQIPSEVLELALQGNELNREYEFSDVNGEAAGYLETGAIIAIPIEKFVKDDEFPPTTVAVGFKYLLGLGFAEFRGDGTLESILEDDSVGVSTNAGGRFAYSTAGSGYAFDLGFSTELSDKLKIDGSVLNIGSITWTDVQEGSASAEGIIDTTDPESADFDYTASEPQPGDDITWKIPRTFRVGSSYKLAEKIVLLADLSWNKSQSSGLTSSQALGVELAPLNFMPMQFVLIKHTKAPIRLDLDWGLRFKHSNFNLSLINASGLVLTSTQGVGIRLNSTIKF